MKKNIVTEYVKNAFKVSSNCFWDRTARRLKHILRNSNYPMGFVQEVIRKVRNEIGTACISSEIGTIDSAIDNEIFSVYRSKFGDHISSNELKDARPAMKKIYIAVPYLRSIHDSLKSVLAELHLYAIKMAPKILVSNRFNFYSNTKDKRDLANIKNASFKVKCETGVCNYEFYAATQSLDVERTFLHITRNESSSPYLHLKQNPMHSLCIELSSVKHCRTKKELQLQSS